MSKSFRGLLGSVFTGVICFFCGVFVAVGGANPLWLGAAAGVVCSAVAVWAGHWD